MRASLVVFIVATTALTMLLTAGAATPATAGGDSPQQVLKRVEKFVKKAKTVELKATLAAAGAPVGKLEQSAIFPDRGRTMFTLGDTTETLYIKDLAFQRGGPADGSVEDLPFDPVYGHPDEYPIFVRPQDLTKLIGQVEAPEIVSQGADGTVLRASFKDPSKVYRVGQNPYTEAHLDVTVADNGEPTAVTLTGSGPDGEVSASTDELTWNKHVAPIRVPSLSDLIDKDAVTSFSDSELYQPKAIPRGWKLALARVLPAGQTAEGCPQVVTAYADPKGHQQIASVIFQFPTSCAQPQQGAPDSPPEPLTLGSYQGTIVDDDNPGVGAQFDANGTTVQVGTSLTRAEFEKMFGSLVPLDFEKPPKATLPAAA